MASAAAGEYRDLEASDSQATSRRMPRAVALAGCLAALAVCACLSLAAKPMLRSAAHRAPAPPPVVQLNAKAIEERGEGGALQFRDAGRAGLASSTRSNAARRGNGFTLAGKSIYFMMTDRFARGDGNNTRCRGDDWCGGTLKGIVERLDYVKGMGFDCIWITPVIKQYEGRDPSNNVTGYHGYWGYDWYKIDEHFGTAQDLKDLSQALHERGMCLVYDMVVNHVGPLVSKADVAKVKPFNETRYFNQLQPRDSFDTYTECWREQKPLDNTVDCATPVQALGSQAFAPNHTTPPYLPFCGVGDYVCEGYNDDVTHEGWFYNLGDLNQSVPFVRKSLLHWAKYMVETYSIDAIRLDTAPFVPRDFLAELQDTVGVEIMGEVTTTNQTFHASYQLEASAHAGGGSAGQRILDGMLNFPLADVAPTGFCGPQHLHSGKGYPFANFNLTRLGSAMKEQLTSGRYDNLDILGNFVDNHDDPPRIGYACKGEHSRITNALAWTMFAKGVPIVYYGTEQGMNRKDDYRDSIWQFGYKTDTSLYRFFADMNKVRRDYNIGTADAEVVTFDENHLVFTRGGKFGAWVYLNNLPGTDEGVVYRGAAPPFPPEGMMWADALAIWWAGHPEPAHLAGGGHDFVARGSMPKVLVLVPVSRPAKVHARSPSSKGAGRAAASAEGRASSPCLEEAVAYHPLDMPEQALSYEADAKACKRRCQAVEGCHHWTYFMADGSCHLSDRHAVAVEQSLGALAGKRMCEELDFE